MTPDQIAQAQRLAWTRIAITQAAYDAICATLPLGSVGYENKTNERGERCSGWIDRLRSLRGPGESFSDVIVRLAANQTRSA